MSHPTVRSWILPAALAGVVAVAAAAHFLRPAPPPSRGWVVVEPDVAGLSRLEVKRRLTDEVMGGRLTLVEAAAAFRALDDGEGRPVPDPANLGLAPGTSDEEVYCRIVISWVEGEASKVRADELHRSLEAELAAFLKNRASPVPSAGNRYGNDD